MAYLLEILADEIINYKTYTYI